MCCLEILYQQSPVCECKKKVPSGGLCRKSCHYNTLRLTLGILAPEPSTNVYEVLQLCEGELVELVELVEPMKSLAFA